MPVLTASIPWNDAPFVGELGGDEDSEQDRKTEMTLAPSNLAIPPDLARARVNLETGLS